MNDDLLVSWDDVLLDIGGQPANVIGYKIYDMTGSPTEVADVTASPHTLVGYISDPAAVYPIAVAAYNSAGVGPMSQTVIPSAPDQSVPEMVQGVTATIIPK
jgi:hypothetical protein